MNETENNIQNFLVILENFVQHLKECGSNNPFENKDNTNPLFVCALNLCDAYHCINDIRAKLTELNNVKEKIRELELRRGGWKQLVPSCFGCDDGKFAHHDCDKKTAETIRDIVDEEKIPIENVLQVFSDYLEKIHFNQSSQKESEMKHVEDFFARS